MKKLLITLAFVVMLASQVFAYNYSWIEDGIHWRVRDDDTGENLKDILLDVGNNVYYLDGNGNMITGWWRNPETDKVYFFDNNETRNYGGMVFGLHMIDGYYRYFGADGSLAVAEKEDSNIYRKVYVDFWADAQGKLYYNNQLLRDTTTNKSEYYTDPAYYTNDYMNNAYLASHGDAYQPIGRIGKDGKEDRSPEVTDYEADLNSTGSEKSSASRTSGGTDYTVDAEGHVSVPDHSAQISNEEKYGPKKVE